MTGGVRGAAELGVDLAAPRSQVLLAIADDALIGGHRASHWTGVAPTIEEDLAFSTLAQDGITQADLWYRTLLGENATDEAVDALAFGRTPDQYRNAIVCERPPRDFAYTLARHWVVVHVDRLRLTAMSRSSEGDLAAVAVRLLHELRYHEQHAAHWFDRLAHGGDEPRRRLEAALEQVLPESLGLFEPVDGEEDPAARAVLPGGHLELYPGFVEVVASQLDAVGCAHLLPASVEELVSAIPSDASGGRRGRHSHDLVEDVWPEMTALYREHPGARW